MSLWDSIKAAVAQPFLGSKPSRLGKGGNGQPPVPYAPGVTWYLPGSGHFPFAPGAKLDYAREAGRLDTNSVAAVCLAWIRDNISQASLCVGSEDDEGEYEPDYSHPLYTFLAGKPNPYYSWRQIWGATADGWKVDGNAYWVLARDGYGLVREVYYAPNIWMRVNTTPQGYIRSYTYTPGRLAQGVTSGGIEYDPEDVIHFRDGIDPYNPIMGLSRLKRVVRNVVGINEAESFTASILRNMGVAGVAIVPKDRMEEMSEAEANAYDKRWRQKTGGENRGSPWVSNVPVELQNIGRSPEELTLDRILDRPEALVCAALGVNALVTGLVSSDATRTYSNIAEAHKLAWENALIPMADAFAEVIKDRLGPEFDLAAEGIVWWDRSQVEALGEQADARAKRAGDLFTTGLYPRDKALMACGFDPVEGTAGERYYGEPTTDEQVGPEQDEPNDTGDTEPDPDDPDEAKEQGSEDAEAEPEKPAEAMRGQQETA